MVLAIKSILVFQNSIASIIYLVYCQSSSITSSVDLGMSAEVPSSLKSYMNPADISKYQLDKICLYAKRQVYSHIHVPPVELSTLLCLTLNATL